MSSADSQHDHAGIRVIPPIYFTLGMGLGILLDYRLPSPSISFPYSNPLGWVIISGSIFLAVWCFHCFKRAGTSVDVRTCTEQLIVHGPYRLSRNPLYVSNLLLMVGLAIGFDIFWLLPMVPVLMVIVYRFAIKPEEIYLTRKFGQIYLNYKKNVRRWI